jgi:hypothetical protein
MREIREAVGGRVPPGQRREHAGQGERGSVIDRADARVRVRRAHEGGVDLAGQADVVAEAPAAGDQTRILLARERLAEAPGRRARAGREEAHGRIVILLLAHRAPRR